VEEALAVQEAARRAMAGDFTQATTVHASAEEPHHEQEAQAHLDERVEADARPEPNTQEQSVAEPAAAAEPERPHVGLAEITELPEASPRVLSCLQCACPGLATASPVY